MLSIYADIGGAYNDGPGAAIRNLAIVTVVRARRWLATAFCGDSASGHATASRFTCLDCLSALSYSRSSFAQPRIRRKPVSMFESMNEFVLSAIVVLLGGVLTSLVGRWLGRRQPVVLLLYVWHTILGFFYSSYVLTYGGDAWDYYQHARFDYVRPNLGTEFVAWITSIPVSLGFTYWPLGFLYNIAGAVGLIFFYTALEEAASANGKSLFTTLLVLICVLIPSLSFWTSGIGKDAPAFLAVGIFLWSVLAFSRRQLAAAVAVVIMLPVRPHIAALMVLSVAAGTLFVKELRGTVRFGIGAISAAAAAFAVPLALLYSGTTRFSSIGEFVSDRQGHNMGGGSSVDISAMNPAVRLLSYLYRPLPTEASGFGQLAESVDNVVLIVLTAIALIAIIRAGGIRTFRTYSIPILYGASCLVLLSQVTANLGLAARQKWMLVPALMLVVVGAWSARKENAESDRTKFRRVSGAPQAAR
jgi:hypothetical protein